MMIAPVADPTNTALQTDPPRRGKPCCFCCCDYRQAVIQVDVVIIFLELIVIIVLAAGGANFLVYAQSDRLTKIEMIFSGVSIITGGLSIYGAYMYSIFLVLINVLWLLVGYVAAIVIAVNYCKDVETVSFVLEGDLYTYPCSIGVLPVLVTGVIMALWVYPHIGFMVYVQRGILSEETYENEKISCCGTYETAGVIPPPAVSTDQLEKGAVDEPVVFAAASTPLSEQMKQTLEQPSADEDAATKNRLLAQEEEINAHRKRVQGQVLAALRRYKIELWNPPYLEAGQRNQDALEQLASDMSADTPEDKNEVNRALRMFQSRSAKKHHIRCI